MSFRTLIVVCAAVIALSAVAMFSMSPSNAEDGGNKGRLKVAVVDLSKVVDQYIRKADEENALRAKVDKINQQIEDLRNIIKGMDATIREKEELLDPASDELARMRLERSVKKVQLDHLIENTKALLNRGKANILAVIYNDFKTACNAYAQKFGYDLVMAKNIPNLSSSDYENLMLQISMQPIYYFAPDMDVTEFMIAEMNKVYTESGKAAAPQGPQPPVQ